MVIVESAPQELAKPKKNEEKKGDGAWWLCQFSAMKREKGSEKSARLALPQNELYFLLVVRLCIIPIFFNPRVLIWHSLGVPWIRGVALCTWCVALFWHLHSETFFKIYFHFTKNVFSMENIRIAYSNGHLFEITFILERVKVFEK